MTLSKMEILDSAEDSTDIYKRNMVSRYLIRSHDKMFERLCNALFITLFYINNTIFGLSLELLSIGYNFNLKVA